jgi:putative Holliday junction resolvase
VTTTTPAGEAPDRGRILALDYGRRRVGAAICDAERILSSPLEVWERRGDAADAKHYRELVTEERVARLVVGLPVHAGGAESQASSEARRWAAWLAKATGKAVVLFDERYTSQEADERLKQAGLSPRLHKDKRDMLAAQILLEHYLEAGCPLGEQPTLPLDDPAEGAR